MQRPEVQFQENTERKASVVYRRMKEKIPILSSCSRRVAKQRRRRGAKAFVLKYVALLLILVTHPAYGANTNTTCGQLALASESKMNNKKKRRLEKYIVRMPPFTLRYSVIETIDTIG